MNSRLAITLTSLLALAGAAFGQARITPQSIIINPTPTDLAVNVSLDKSGENPVYRIGDPIRLNVSVNQDAYVYLFNVDETNNQIDLILPNKYDSSNLMRAGETRQFGSAGSFRFSVGGPSGQNKVLAVASKRQLSTDQIYSFQGNQKTATVTVTTQDSLARALSIIIEPVPQTDWVTSVAFYQVAAVNQPSPGSISLGNVPSGANVFLDGMLVGQTPVSFTATAGQHNIRITLSGFMDYQRTFSLRAGERITLNVSLQRAQGSLSVRNAPSNALLFVNGTSRGQVGNIGRLGLPAGSYEVVVIAPGYHAYVTTVTIQGGQATEVGAQLSRL